MAAWCWEGCQWAGTSSGLFSAGVCLPPTTVGGQGKSGESPARSRHCNRMRQPHNATGTPQRTWEGAATGKPVARRPASDRKPQKIPRGKGKAHMTHHRIGTLGLLLALTIATAAPAAAAPVTVNLRVEGSTSTI